MLINKCIGERSLHCNVNLLCQIKLNFRLRMNVGCFRRGVRPNGNFFLNSKINIYSLFSKAKTVIFSIRFFTLTRLLHFEEFFHYSRKIIHVFMSTRLNILKYNLVSVVVEFELCCVHSAIHVGSDSKVTLNFPSCV